MKSISKNNVNEIIINKSRFITILANVNNMDEVNDKMAYYKKLYKGATHYCFAYIIGAYLKYDDDGEPCGTAGIPMLNVLKKHDLSNILCIIIRYFGGVKLGSGGLVRAYSKCVSEALIDAEIAYFEPGYFVEIEFNYDDTKLIDNLLKQIVVYKTFNEKIIYRFKISEVYFLEIANALNEKALIIKKEPILVIV